MYNGNIDLSIHISNNDLNQILVNILLENIDSHKITIQPLYLWGNLQINISDANGLKVFSADKPKLFSLTNDDLITIKENQNITLTINLYEHFNFNRNFTQPYSIYAQYKTSDIGGGNEKLNSWKGELISNIIEFKITS
jgi:hypothetical protein